MTSIYFPQSAAKSGEKNQVSLTSSYKTTSVFTPADALREKEQEFTLQPIPGPIPEETNHSEGIIGEWEPVQVSNEIKESNTSKDFKSDKNQDEFKFDYQGNKRKEVYQGDDDDGDGERIHSFKIKEKSMPLNESEDALEGEPKEEIVFKKRKIKGNLRKKQS